jgi:hypothetical protein
MEETEHDLEIGIPREVISLKSSSRNLRMLSCLLFLYNILFIKGGVLLLFSFEELIGYSVIQFFNPNGIIYYFYISLISLGYRFYLIEQLKNPIFIIYYTIPFIALKSFFVFSLLIFRDRLLQLDRNSLIMIRNIRYL